VYAQDPPGAYWVQSMAVASPSVVSMFGVPPGVAVPVGVPRVGVGLGVKPLGVVDGGGVADGDGVGVISALAGQIVKP